MVAVLDSKGYHVYMDNFFSLVGLAESLMRDNTFMIGTTRVNRRRWPPSMKDKQTLNKLMKRGETRSTILKGTTIECLVWKDNTVVPLINTITNPTKMTTVK